MIIASNVIQTFFNTLHLLNNYYCLKEHKIYLLTLVRKLSSTAKIHKRQVKVIG